MFGLCLEICCFEHLCGCDDEMKLQTQWLIRACEAVFSSCRCAGPVVRESGACVIEPRVHEGKLVTFGG